ncbi:hypothetical protein ABZP36_036008, partial [Zizania latifolia]
MDQARRLVASVQRRADYAPEHKLWFALSSGGGATCGRFIYKGQRSNFDFDEKFTVFTGVEVRRHCNKNGSTRLQM